jgi:hypothetical protein
VNYRSNKAYAPSEKLANKKPCPVSLKKGVRMTKNPEHEASKPRLKAAFLEVVDNQLKANDPPETRETLDA